MTKYCGMAFMSFESASRAAIWFGLYCSGFVVEPPEDVVEVPVGTGPKLVGWPVYTWETRVGLDVFAPRLTVATVLLSLSELTRPPADSKCWVRPPGFGSRGAPVLQAIPV